MSWRCLLRPLAVESLAGNLNIVNNLKLKAIRSKGQIFQPEI